MQTNRLTDPLLILISLPVKGEFILNCEWARRDFNLFVQRSLDVIWQQIIWWAFLRHEEYCYSVGWSGRERLFTINDWRLYRWRCTKLPTDIQTNTISGATCYPITVTGMSLFALFQFLLTGTQMFGITLASEWPYNLHLEIATTQFLFFFWFTVRGSKQQKQQFGENIFFLFPRLFPANCVTNILHGATQNNNIFAISKISKFNNTHNKNGCNWCRLVSSPNSPRQLNYH